jgi:AraC-like DNA-binding protein
MSQAVAVSHGAFGRAALYKLDRPILTHAHREGHIVFYLSDATASMTVGCQKVAIDGITAAAVSPWEAHNFELEPGAGSCTCLVLYIKPVWFLENAQSAEFALSFGASRLRLTPGLSQLVSKLAAGLINSTGEIDVDPLLFDITRLSYQLSWQGNCPTVSDLDRKIPFSDFRVRRALRLLKDVVGDEVEMEAIAREVGLSRPHFFKLFKQQMGITPNMYLNTLRSEQAIEDLTGTGKTVADIAEDLGFSSQASFSRFFASNVGISPSEYRRVAHIN